MSFQIDFLVSIGMFITMIFLLLHFVLSSDYQTDLEAKFKFYKINKYILPNIIDYAYTFSIILNSSEQLINEIVEFDYKNLKMNINPNSTMIFDENGNTVQYDVINTTIKFVVNVSANITKVFYIYVNDNTNATHQNIYVNGNNSINESITPMRAIEIIWHENLIKLSNRSYSKLRNIVKADFNITIGNFSYGVEAKGKNIVSFYQPIIYEENATLKKGILKFMVIQ